MMYTLLLLHARFLCRTCNLLSIHFLCAIPSQHTCTRLLRKISLYKSSTIIDSDPNRERKAAFHTVI